MGGIQQDVPAALAIAPAATTRDYEDLLARLNALPTLVDQTIALLEKGLAAGVTPPKSHPARRARPGARPARRRSAARARCSRRSGELPSTVPPDDQERHQPRGPARLSGEGGAGVPQAPALPHRDLHPGRPGDHRPRRPCPTAPPGTPTACAATTTTDLTPQQIHEIGLSEVKRIRAEMDKVIAGTGFKGSFAEFVRFLRTDPALLLRQARGPGGRLPRHRQADRPRAGHALRHPAAPRPTA